MKSKYLRLVRVNSLLFFSALLIIGAAGCKTPDYSAAMEAPAAITNTVLPRLRIGDTVTVTFSGIDQPPLPQEKPIKDDGTITLPDVGSVQAAGKTPSELEEVIHHLYVPAIYTHLNVTVRTTSDLVYFVRGEVNKKDRILWVGPTTVTQAISSAGDFTDFANHKNVVLIRGDKRFKLNVDKILEGKEPDPPVYPNDQIVVKRRLF